MFASDFCNLYLLHSYKHPNTIDISITKLGIHTGSHGQGLERGDPVVYPLGVIVIFVQELHSTCAIPPLVVTYAYSSPQRRRIFGQHEAHAQASSLPCCVSRAMPCATRRNAARMHLPKKARTNMRLVRVMRRQDVAVAHLVDEPAWKVDRGCCWGYSIPL